MLTPAIAIAVALIGFLQWRTAERKRRQELFDKRFAFFQNLWSIYEDQVIGEGPPADYTDFLQYAHEAEFLFGGDVTSHMFQIEERTQKGGLEYDWFSKPFKKYLVIEQGFWR